MVKKKKLASKPLSTIMKEKKADKTIKQQQKQYKEMKKDSKVDPKKAQMLLGLNRELMDRCEKSIDIFDAKIQQASEKITEMAPDHPALSAILKDTTELVAYFKEQIHTLRETYDEVDVMSRVLQIQKNLQKSYQVVEQSFQEFNTTVPNGANNI